MSLSSTNYSSSPVPLLNWTYDVYLSYHDKHSGKSFAIDLYSALTRAGLSVYINNHNLRIGDHTNSSVIEDSRSSIIVFSPNFNASTSFLEEMEKILECRRTIGQVFVPVFYNVDPSYIRKQKGTFGEAFENQSILTKDQSMRYREALTQAASLSGFPVMSSRNENTDIINIVQCLFSLTKDSYLFVAHYPVGVESRVKDMMQLLINEPSKDVRIIGIWGINGVGKTTIAKATYNQMAYRFEDKSFLSDINSSCEQSNGLLYLQGQLLSDIYKTPTMKIKSVELGKIMLQNRLSHKKIFLVLDDVNNLDQLNALCGNRAMFGPGSRIIITTSDKYILRRFQVDHVYKMKYMDNTESLELFSWYAFNTPSPNERYTDLCRDAVEYCGGLPLALEVIGSFLFDRSVAEWKSALKKFNFIPNNIIMEKIRTSFDDLSDNVEKKTFLDITTLFIGMDKDDVIQTLIFSGSFSNSIIEVLEDKSLVTVDSENRIGMHTLVQGVGREIIRQQSMGMAETKLYDVFLSFRGEDSRAKFISHLYSSLENAGIYVFKDDDGIQRGDQISVSLLQAIGQSKISIVVLSRNFANSKWCMLELERIVEIGRTKGMVVVPVFYEVDPSEVRNQTGKFGESFEYLMSTISVDEYTKRNWKAALYEVGGIAGIVIINSRNESEDIKKIVNLVTHLLNKTELFVADHPVGVESRVQDVIQLLDSQTSKDLLLLGIWGMGGIGKTTIAKAVYNEISHDFEAKSFLLNVRDAWKLDNDKISLQQRLLSNIYKSTKIKIDDIESGKMILQERLCKKRIFLVIDDVNKIDQLSALCGDRKWFGEGSRIIITTRDDGLLSKLKVDHVYRMKEMGDSESLELFSWHAFNQPTPSEGFTNLSRDVVKYSGGLPLALQVIGSFLLTMRREAEWNSVLDKLKLIPDDEVTEKLRISFDGLSDDDVKDIFLDITFFFIGMDREDVTNILTDCGHFPEIGISILVQQSLITVDRKNKIGMHDLLRDMGRDIVRKKSKDGGKEPSRLWRYEDVHELSKDTSSLNVKGLSLKMSETDSTTYLETKAFEKMDKLRLLQLAGVQLDGNYKYISRHLRWLSWHGFPLELTPANFHQESLVSVNLKYSNLKQVWRKSQLLKNLKILNLSHSHNLRRTPDFSNLPNLEKLILKDCPSLTSVSSSIGHLKKILLINLKDCTGLCELPRSIYKLDSLKTLILSGCKKIGRLEEDIEQMQSLTTLVADNTAITRVPFALVRSKSIGFISLCGYEGFARKVFPSIIHSWLSPSNKIPSVLQALAGTPCLDFTDEQNKSFYCLSSIFEDLQILQRLWLKCDSEAQLKQTVASILDSFNTQNCKGFSNMGTTTSTRCNQVCISSSKNSLTSLLIQMGVSCNVTTVLRENILQKMSSIGSGLLPGDNYPNWLSFKSNGSSVTFKVPQLDGRNLKTIMCIVYSSYPYNTTTEGFEIFLVINCTKNTIQVYKRDALLAFFDEEEWQRVISNIEPGNEIKVVVLTNELIVKKIKIYLVYDEPSDEKAKHCDVPDENGIVSSGDETIFGRLFAAVRNPRKTPDATASVETTTTKQPEDSTTQKPFMRLKTTANKRKHSPTATSTEDSDVPRPPNKSKGTPSRVERRKKKQSDTLVSKPAPVPSTKSGGSSSPAASPKPEDSTAQKPFMRLKTTANKRKHSLAATSTEDSDVPQPPNKSKGTPSRVERRKKKQSDTLVSKPAPVPSTKSGGSSSPATSPKRLKTTTNKRKHSPTATSSEDTDVPQPPKKSEGTSSRVERRKKKQSDTLVLKPTHVPSTESGGSSSPAASQKFQNTNKVPQKSKAVQNVPTLSSPIAEYTPRSETATFRPSLSHKSSERGSNAEINKFVEGVSPQKPVLPTYKETFEGESPEIPVVNVDDSSEEAHEGPMCGVLDGADAETVGEPETSVPIPALLLSSKPPSLTKSIPSTSTGPGLSPEDLATLKKDNPLAYLKAIINARESSTDKSFSVSTASRDKPLSDPCNALLKQLKAKFFDVDLFQLLESNNLVSYDLKNLLKQVEPLDVSLEVSEIVIELRIMVEHVSADVFRVQQTMATIDSKSKDQSLAWEGAIESTNKVTHLEGESKARKAQVAVYDRDIAAWESEIKVLQKKILEATNRKEELLSFDAGAIQKEVELGLQHVEKAHALGEEIGELVRFKSACEKRMALQRSKYLKMKDSLPF